MKGAALCQWDISYTTCITVSVRTQDLLAVNKRKVIGAPISRGVRGCFRRVRGWSSARFGYRRVDLDFSPFGDTMMLVSTRERRAANAACPRSRPPALAMDQIAEQLTIDIGEAVSATTLNGWTSISDKIQRFPLKTKYSFKRCEARDRLADMDVKLRSTCRERAFDITLRNDLNE